MSYERLIVEVKKYPCLYDKRHEFYRHKVKRDRSWKEIANALGEEKVSCQGRWRLIRDRFVRDMNKKPASKWSLMKKLMFLKEHVALSSRSKTQDSENGEETDESVCLKYECDDPTFMQFADDDESNRTLYDYKNPVPSINFEEIHILNSPTQSTCAPTQEETTDTTPTSMKVGGIKRRREVSDAEQHFVSFVNSVKDMINSKFDSNAQQHRRTSRNEDFLGVLNGYMLKLNEDQQDALKIEVLNLVYKRSMEMKSNKT